MISTSERVLAVAILTLAFEVNAAPMLQSFSATMITNGKIIATVYYSASNKYFYTEQTSGPSPGVARIYRPDLNTIFTYSVPSSASAKQLRQGDELYKAFVRNLLFFDNAIEDAFDDPNKKLVGTETIDGKMAEKYSFRAKYFHGYVWFIPESLRDCPPWWRTWTHTVTPLLRLATS